MSGNNNKNKIKKSNTLDREEYGYGYDLSPDDLDVRGLNDEAETIADNENKVKPTNNNRHK
ncbi:hypothetical protein WAX74_05605 [Psychrobacillus sp. FJAT-51614]|uniref:DUF4021 domain-containing protein n=1 Tax=Psychrobacillus mangrovi TaxID=3117745 RepID=A0ABU8F4G7_9BACI